MDWFLPLEVLPGWPLAPEVSPYHMVWLLLLGPVAVGLVILVITFTPTWVRKFRQEPSGSEMVLRDQAAAPVRES